MKNTLLFILVFIPFTIYAQDNSVCFDEKETKQIEEMSLEIDDIHNSAAEIEFEDPILIIQDWDGRVYTNGGETEPIKAKLRIGHFIERDLEISLPVNVMVREKPPDPMFRLRFRAQAMVLFPDTVKIFQGDNRRPFDGGIGLDFFHIDIWNLSINAGVLSCGSTVGVDITKNFGLHTGYVFVYSGFRSGGTFGMYFSFN